MLGVLGLCVMLLCGILTSGTVVYAIDCDTIPAVPAVECDMLGRLAFGSDEGGGCWGWIAPNGEEYAIAVNGDGVEFLRVSTMTHIGTWAGAGFLREVRTYRNYCYAMSCCYDVGGPGISIFDLQDLPNSAPLVGKFSGVPTPCDNFSIDTARGYMYLAQQGWLRILSLADPLHPLPVRSIYAGGLYNVTAINDTAYAALGDSGAFAIWDCIDKQNPAEITHVRIPGVGNHVSSTWPTEDRRFLVTTEDRPPLRTLKIWNIENKSSVYQVSEYLGPGGIPRMAQVEGSYAYVAHLSSGVSILNIENPECPVEVAVYDTYSANNDPDTFGCWGVYPHTGGRGTVYACNHRADLYVLQTNIAPILFDATPRVGNAPLSVAFTDMSPYAMTWSWQFGDGNSSLLQNPSHIFDAGLYSVRLDISSPTGIGRKIEPNYVTAFAETLKVADRQVFLGTPVTWDITYHNNVPVTEIKLPIQLSNVPSVATLDSITTTGCRTENFELKEFALQQYGSGRAVLRLKANNGAGAAAMPVGNGPVARVYLTISESATAGQQVVLTMPPIGIAQHTRTAWTYTAADTLDLFGGIATVAGACDCSCHGDPSCDGNHDVLDVVRVVGVAFRNILPEIDPLCPHGGRTDLNCSGDTDVIDVVNIVSIAFRNVSAHSIICNPCSL